MTDNLMQIGVQAGISGDQQIRIALRAILDSGGIAPISTLYRAVEQNMKGAQLSEQGEASLRYFINTVAVKAGYVYPLDPENPGWRITPEGRDLIQATPVLAEEVEEVVNVETEQAVIIPSNSARGAAFELYVLELLKKIYPDYAWYHQGVHKSKERGLDFIGSRLGNLADCPEFIDVQVKFYAESNIPSPIEWFKFLAGCFARRIDQAVFITTGRLTSEQRREAGEARVVVIEGRSEITRIASRYSIREFELFEDSQN